MKHKNTTTRRALLTATLGLGIALGIGAPASAFVGPFTPGVPWSGNLSSIFLGGAPTKIQLAVDATGTAGMLTVGNAAAMFATLTYNSNTQAVTITAASGLTIKGKVPFSVAGTAILQEGSYTNGFASGYVSFERDQPQGVVAPVADGNVASLEILPPDWLGSFVIGTNAPGSMRFQHEIPAPSRELPAFNEIYGTVMVNDLLFTTVMTFSPRANTDGTYSFDLVGMTGAPGGLLMTMSGNFQPASSNLRVATPAYLTGDFQLTNTRGAVVATARFALRAIS